MARRKAVLASNSSPYQASMALRIIPQDIEKTSIFLLFNKLEQISDLTVQVPAQSIYHFELYAVGSLVIHASDCPPVQTCIPGDICNF